MNQSRINAAKSAAKDSIAPAVYSVVSPFITSNPILLGSLGLVAATFGAVVIYRQERLNQMVTDILDQPDIYTETILQSSDFQDGLIVHLDTYFKLRGSEKLKIAQNIFHDFASSKSMPVYPLERYDDTLTKISDAGIRFLGFLETTIPEIKEAYLFSKMRQKGNSLTEKNIANMRKAYVENEPLSKFVDIHIEKEADKKMRSAKEPNEQPIILEEKFRKSIASDIGLVISELEQLGLVRSFSHQTPGWDGGATVSGYNLTHYGRMFTSVVKPERTV